MPISVLGPEGGDGAPVQFATRAEELGYDTVWIGELWGNDAFVSLARIAEATDDIGLGTAIVNAYSRTPAVLAGAAASLDAAAEGRVRLGIGTSTETAIENLHGLSFDRPARRLHETVELVRSILGGEGRIEYEGEVITADGVPALDADVSVYAAALGPATRRATGRVADGWLPHNVPFDDLDRAYEVVADAAREAGRDPDLHVAPYVPAAVAVDPADARTELRSHLAYYVGSAEGYRRAVATRFPDAADRVATAWRGGDRDDARAAVTDEMVDALGVAGTPESARERLREIAAIDVVDEPIVVVPAGTSEERRRRTIEALAPDRD
jgi:alkanesulfonate monooxygenase SsuD/methylene tetrahydromethanopterin reductase-like flavin-dependent oxidoreductase (luciferase family)